MSFSRPAILDIVQDTVSRDEAQYEPSIPNVAPVDEVREPKLRSLGQHDMNARREMMYINQSERGQNMTV